MSELRERLRIESSESSVQASLPVLFFGDALTAQVATVGLNPSKREYLDPHGEILAGRSQRFATTTSLGAVSRAGLSDGQATEAIEVMRDYYDDGRPTYGSYFGHLTHFLSGIGTSYRERSATHLDLVQESTDPVWSRLGPRERSGLLARDLPFLVWQLETLPHLQAVVCAGKTVSKELQARIHVDVEETGVMKRIRWWLGVAHFGARDLQIGGWNYPLDRPTGLGTAGEIALGEMFGAALL
jgi:uracil-DNA glycosylase